jgi:serine/threonine protein phosphatase 1
VWSRIFSRTNRPPALPRLPEGIRIYAVGDVHGRVDLVNDVLSQIDLDIALNPAPRPLVVFLGDYIDRGPASRAVLDRLADTGFIREAVFLKGNHERFAIEFLKDPSVLETWRQFGGLETLVSYGIHPSIRPTHNESMELSRAFARALPDSHLRFLQTLKLSFSCGDFFFVHAGVRPGVPLLRQREEDLLWIRDEFLNCDEDFGKFVVHGHEPVREPDMRINRINIDTGAFATGRLCCLIIEGTTLIPITDRNGWRKRIFRSRPA